MLADSSHVFFCFQSTNLGEADHNRTNRVDAETLTTIDQKIPPEEGNVVNGAGLNLFPKKSKLCIKGN